MRETDQYLYLGSFFDYELSTSRIITGYLLTVPFVAFILKNALNKIFPMLLSTLMLIGVLPGVIIYILSTKESIYVFFIFYIYMVFILSFLVRKKLAFSVKKVGGSSDLSTDFNNESINLTLFKLVGLFGFVFYVYLSIKYINVMSFSGISEVYVQRGLFAGIVTWWEGYLIMFSKSIAAFSLLIVAIKLRNVNYLLPCLFIFLVDYSLGAHKSSLISMIFSILYYFVFSKMNIKKYYFLVVTLGVTLFSLLLQYAIIFKSSWLIVSIALYDRAFHVTSGLFARMYEYTNANYFFHGGTGLIGKIFSGVDNGMASTVEIGEAYFSETVQANADLVADGYLNFGTAGSFFQLFILWLIFNKRDNKIFEDNFILIMPLLFVYSKLLFSTGLQIVLLSGGMFFFVLLIKFGFRKGKVNFFVSKKQESVS